MYRLPYIRWKFYFIFHYSLNDKKALSKLQEYAKLFNMDKKSGIEIAEAEPHITDRYGIPSAIGQGTHNYSTVQIALKS